MDKGDKIREDFGYTGKPKQWQQGFDALLKHIPEYIEAFAKDTALAQTIMADTLLRMALTASRGRLLDVTNTEHDKVFEKIAEYLDKKYPKNLGCPRLD